MTSKIKAILFLLGCNEGQSKRYRVHNHIEYLLGRGVHAEWAWDIHERIFDRDYLKTFDAIVVFRSGMNDRVDRFFDVANELSIPLIYDIDDLVFDPSVVDLIDVYKRMSPEAQEEYRNGIYSIYDTIQRCDYITASTSYLGKRLHETFRKPSFVVPFGVSNEQIAISRQLSPWNGEFKFFGYLSGTATHQADFAEAAAALERILLEYDDVYLKLIGPLDIATLMPRATHKVIRLDFMDWRDLVIESGSLYANLAPFEYPTPFCQSKSQLKFIEAGMCRVPTIASPVPSYLEGIRSGENGYIASNEDEWYAAMKALVESPAHRDALGEEAYRTVCMNHFPERIGAVLEDVYGECVDRHGTDVRSEDETAAFPLMPARRNGLRISWIIPQPFEASGGHRNIFRAIKYLAQFGHSLTVYVLPDNLRFADGHAIDEFIARHFFPLNAEKVVLGVDAIEECDVLVSTYWTTAYHARKNADKTTAQIYFLQDFEPMFFPMGTDYVRAMQTYKFGFRFVCSGPWPLRMLKATFDIDNGDFFRFPVDRDIYYPAPVKRRGPRPRVAFFARPHMPRRCYDLGVWALQIVKERMPEVEVVFYGDDAAKYQNIPYEYTALGMTKTIQELGQLYRSADVGICFSTTNPSLVPFEMMACGCPVVDLDVNGNEVNYGSRDNVCLVEPSPEAIADGVLAVLQNKQYAEQLSANGRDYAEIFPSELEMVKLIESFFVKEFERARGERFLLSA